MALSHRLSIAVIFIALQLISSTQQTLNPNPKSQPPQFHLSTTTAAAQSSSSFAASLETLQKQIGYEFQSIDLLRRALTHSSYSRENSRSLSILGLSAIQTSTSLKLLQKDLDVSAKEMNGRIREVSDVDDCAAAGTRLGLQKVVRVSARTNATAPAVVCGAFRAVFGGIAVDCGKVEIAGEVFRRVTGGGGVAAVL